MRPNLVKFYAVFTRKTLTQPITGQSSHWPVVYRLIYRRVMLPSRSGVALLIAALLATCARPWCEAQTSPQPGDAATLKLIPIPREVSAGAVQSLAGRRPDQLRCTLRSRRTSLAIDDFKSALAAQGVPVEHNLLGQPASHPLWHLARELHLQPTR